jgi:hypothetical protein
LVPGPPLDGSGLATYNDRPVRPREGLRRLLVYWLMFGYFAVGAMLIRPQPGKRPGPVMLTLGSLLVALAIGIRFEVGADWETYKFLFSYANYADLGRVLTIGDPGYQFLNWAVQRFGGEIWVVNLVCGAIFAVGLYRFARSQPDPWLAFVVAIPYLVVVVAMGYTRQAVAIGILMAGLASLKHGASILRFAAYVAAAALFHKTVVVVLPLVIFASQRSRMLNVLAGIAGFILLYDVFLSSSVEGFVRNYIGTEYSSQGAAIRVVMNLVPAVALFLFRRRLELGPVELKAWTYFSIAAVAMPLALFILPSTTVVDRLSLYLIPLQLAVLPRLAYLFKGRFLGRSLVIGYSALVLFVWLNFAVHAEYWVPYQFYPVFD